MNLREQSAKISCDNMTKLAIKEYDNNYNIFENIIERDNSTILNRNFLPSLHITNKSCIYKREEYNKGDWINQYESKDIKIKFNEQTKNKTNNCLSI